MKTAFQIFEEIKQDIINNVSEVCLSDDLTNLIDSAPWINDIQNAQNEGRNHFEISHAHTKDNRPYQVNF